ncbi:MAG: hypothetical protein WC860_09870 [Candidatus Margulisiibacteriota bacterium]|jgi:hypothetical protein
MKVTNFLLTILIISLFFIVKNKLVLAKIMPSYEFIGGEVYAWQDVKPYSYKTSPKNLIPSPDAGFKETLAKIRRMRKKLSPYIFEGEKCGRKFAKRFMNDFIDEKVKFIKPILETSFQDDPRLQKILKKYPNFELKVGNLENPTRQPSIVKWYYSYFNYRLYKVDIDNNSKNGDEYVLYSGGYYNQFSDKQDYDAMEIINIKKEKKKSIYLNVQDSVDYKTLKHTQQYSGIIKYKKQYYFYDIENFGNGFYNSIYKWRSRHNFVTIFFTF